MRQEDGDAIGAPRALIGGFGSSSSGVEATASQVVQKYITRGIIIIMATTNITGSKQEIMYYIYCMPHKKFRIVPLLYLSTTLPLSVFSSPKLLNMWLTSQS